MPDEVVQQGGTATATSNGATTVSEDKFDPATLDPKLVPVYKGMEAAHTRRSQVLAEERAQFDSERSTWLAEQEANRQASDQAKASQVAQGQAVETIDQLLSVVDQRTQAHLQPLLEQQAMSRINELKNDPKFGKIFQEMMPEVVKKMKASKMDVHDAFASVSRDKVYEAGRRAAYDELEANKAKPASIKPGVSTVTQPKKFNSIREAAEANREKLYT